MVCSEKLAGGPAARSGSAKQNRQMRCTLLSILAGREVGRCYGEPIAGCRKDFLAADEHRFKECKRFVFESARFIGVYLRPIIPNDFSAARYGCSRHSRQGSWKVATVSLTCALVVASPK